LDNLLENLDDTGAKDLNLMLPNTNPALLNNTHTGDLMPNIDPSLLDIPSDLSGSRAILSTPGPSSAAADSDLVIVGSSKRKTPCADNLPFAESMAAKNACVRSPSVVEMVSP